jgi:hypothetical protein
VNSEPSSLGGYGDVPRVSPWGLLAHRAYRRCDLQERAANRPSLGILAENRPERVLSPKQTRSLDKLLGTPPAMARPPLINITYNFPHDIGSQSHLKNSLVNMDRRGELEVIKLDLVPR